jgi:hypothetical protein
VVGNDDNHLLDDTLGRDCVMVEGLVCEEHVESHVTVGLLSDMGRCASAAVCGRCWPEQTWICTAHAQFACCPATALVIRRWQVSFRVMSA